MSDTEQTPEGVDDAAPEKSPVKHDLAIVIAKAANGEINARLSDDFQELLDAMYDEAQARGKARGDFTLKLKVKMSGTGQIILTCETKHTKPKPELGEAWFWTDKDGRLVTEDPKQQKLPLKAVPISREVKSVGQKSGAR